MKNKYPFTLKLLAILLFTGSVAMAQNAAVNISPAERETLVNEILNSDQDAYQDFTEASQVTDEVLARHMRRTNHTNVLNNLFVNTSTCTNSLTTTFADNNSHTGNFFDVTAHDTITINDLYLNTDSTSLIVKIWTRPGTHVGNETDSTGWTFQHTAAFSGGTNVSIGGGLNISMNAGETMGFYVLLDSWGAMRYTNGTGLGDTAATNADLTIFQGRGGADVPFGNSLFTPRIWNGTICYNNTSSAPSCTNPVSINMKPSGLKSFWGLNDPYTVYYGVSQWKHITLSHSGGVGPYTYTWGNAGSGQLKNQSANGKKISLFEPTGPAKVWVTVHDGGTGCDWTDTMDVAWDNSMFCGTMNPKTWYLTVCEDGVTKCVSWGMAKSLIKGGNADIGACAEQPAKMAPTAIAASLYPNPTNDLTTIEYASETAGEGTLMVMDMNGRVLQQSTVMVNAGKQYQGIDLSDMPTGVYIVRLSTDHDVFTERLQLVK